MNKTSFFYLFILQQRNKLNFCGFYTRCIFLYFYLLQEKQMC